MNLKTIDKLTGMTDIIRRTYNLLLYYIQTETPTIEIQKAQTMGNFFLLRQGMTPANTLYTCATT